MNVGAARRSPFEVTVDDQSGTDQLVDIQKVILSPQDDTVALARALPWWLKEIDGGAHQTSIGNKIDISNSRYSLNTYHFDNKGRLGAYNIIFENFQTIKGGDRSERIIIDGQKTGIKNIFTGNGNDVVKTDVVNSRIDFGNGDDTLLHAGAGSIINLGEGRDKVAISNDILVTNVTANDIIATIDGHVEHGAVGSLNSESGWINSSDGTRYGLDTQGELEIKDALGDITTVTHYSGGYDVPLTEQTGGIFVGRAALNAYRLMEPKPQKPFDNIETTFKYGRALWFT